jgi:hypothetical protein
VSEQSRANDFPLRVRLLERDVKELQSDVEALQREQPAVMAERVSSMTRQIADLRDDIRSFRRVFFTFAVALAATVIGSIIALIIAGGQP